jgi:3-oxoacyl-[acyl-carrier-protein] synthase III
MKRIGILGLGMHLPPAVRSNDWWPAEVVARWSSGPTGGPPPTDLTPSGAAIVAAMREQAGDPFRGAVVRHVLDETGSILEMEVLAAREALARAGVVAQDIDLVLTCSAPTDHQLTNSACALHQALGLPRNAYALQVDGAQHAFLLQLSLARSMILGGEASHGLLVQSSALSRLIDPVSPISPMFGDGATAVVVGPVADDKGILASTHRTDGRLPNTLVASVPGKHWYDDGRSVLHMADPAGMRDILLRTVDVSRESILAALAAAGHAPADVDVFAMHQGMPWLRRLVQDHAGLDRARAVDTFATTGHLFGAFLTSTLVAARDQGAVGEGDLVVLAGGGNGMSYGAAVMRWGR